MTDYLIDFIERNKDKSFMKNLKKYGDLDGWGRKKVISSFLTHLFIDSEMGHDNVEYQKDLVGILNELVYFGSDKFFEWLEENIVIEEEGENI